MSFPRYVKCKDSGVEWLGEVPAHWEVMALRRAIAAPLSNGIFKKKEEFGEGVLLINVFDIYRPDFKVDLDGLDRVRCDPSETSIYEVLSGDLFFVRSSLKQEGIAVVAMAESCAEPVVFECHLIRARPNRRLLDGRFGSYVLNSVVYRSSMVAKAKITTMTTIDQEAILSTLLPLPSVDEQTHIAAFLDQETAKIDALVAEQRRLMELLNEKRQAVISHAVTKGLNPNVPTKPSGIEWLGDVPEHWKISLLKRAFRSVDYGISDALDSEGAVAILRMGNIANGKIVAADLKYTDSVDPSLFLKSGDLLYNRTNSLDLIGKVGMFLGNGETPVSFASYLVRLRTVDESLPDYFAYLLNTEGILGLARANAFVAIGQCNLNPTRYGQITIAVPPRDEQVAIVGYLNTEIAKLDTLTAEAQRAIDLLQERRTALISAAVTGQINVRELVRAEAA